MVTKRRTMLQDGCRIATVLWVGYGNNCLDLDFLHGIWLLCCGYTRSEASSQEYLSAVPLYPAHCTKYNRGNLCWQSYFESNL